MRIKFVVAAAERLKSHLGDLIRDDCDTDVSINNGVTVRTKQIGGHVLF